MASTDPALKKFFEIVSRNVRRARVRLTLEKYRGQIGWGATPEDAEGNIINDPSDGEVPLIVSDGLLLAKESLLVLDTPWNVSP